MVSLRGWDERRVHGKVAERPVVYPVETGGLYRSISIEHEGTSGAPSHGTFRHTCNTVARDGRVDSTVINHNGPKSNMLPGARRVSSELQAFRVRSKPHQRVTLGLRYIFVQSDKRHFCGDVLALDKDRSATSV